MLFCLFGSAPMDNLSSSPGSSGDEASVTNEISTANMTRRPNASGRGPPPPPKRTDIDLGAILSIDQKLQLQQLMANTLDTMQKNLRDSFDLMGQNRDGSCEGIRTPTAVSCTLPNPRSAKYAHLYGLTPLVTEKGPKEDQEKEKGTEKDGKSVQKEVAKPNLVPSAPTYSPTLLALAAGGNLKIPKSIAEASAMNRRDENDVLTSGMLELKRDALTHFGKWRGSVVRRLGEIIIKDGGNAGNVMKPAQYLAQGNNARRPGSAGRGRPQRPVSGKFFLCPATASIRLGFFWIPKPLPRRSNVCLYQPAD